MIETEEDRALFFDGDEFGDIAIVTDGTDAPYQVPVIFDLRPPFTATNFKGFRGTNDFGRDMGEVSGTKPRIVGPDPRLAVVKAGRTQIHVKGEDYLAYKSYPDGTGLTIVEMTVA